MNSIDGNKIRNVVWFTVSDYGANSLVSVQDFAPTLSRKSDAAVFGPYQVISDIPLEVLAEVDNRTVYADTNKIPEIKASHTRKGGA